MKIKYKKSQIMMKYTKLYSANTDDIDYYRNKETIFNVNLKELRLNLH